jgi:hypothetical protein
VEPALWGFVGTLVGAIVGASASIVTTMITTRNATRLRREVDSLERLERARAFQRDNLLQVQDVLLDAMRLMGRAHMEELLEFRRSGNWGKGYLSDEVNEKILLANRRMFALVERIADDSLRLELKTIHTKLNGTLSATSDVEADTLLNEAAAAAYSVMEHLGEVLRKHY